MCAIFKIRLFCSGIAWLSPARVLRFLVNSDSGRNPYQRFVWVGKSFSHILTLRDELLSRTGQFIKKREIF